MSPHAQPGPTPLPDDQLRMETRPADPTPAADPSSSGSGSFDRRILLGVAGLAGVAAFSRLAKAGPLNPPPGPITSTGITLGELGQRMDRVSAKVATSDAGVAEPRTPLAGLPSSPTAQYVITQPGAYFMTGDIPQQQDRVAIDIQCDHVDIDCQGFAFKVGIGVSTPSSCIRASGRTNIEIYDAAFRGWNGCCIDCDDCDDVFASDCIFHSCSAPPTMNADGTVSPGATVRCRDRCAMEDLHFVGCDGRQIQARHGSYCCEVVVADCNGDGAIVMGNDGEVEDCLFRNVSGGAVRCGSGACVDSCAVLNGNVVIGSVSDSHIRCGDGSCVSDSEVRNSVGLAFSLGSDCVVDCCDVTGGSGGAFRCVDGCCLDGCTVLSHSSTACIITNLRTRINELEARLCAGGLLLHVGNDSTVECSEITGGSGGAIHCDDACCVEDCSVINHAGVAIECSSRCTIDSCKVVASWGVSCGPECCVSDNEISYDGSGGGGGGGGAINVSGERCSITGNYVAGQIYIFGGSDRCLIEDNHCVGTGGTVGTGGASISIAAGVVGCSVRSNHIHRASTTNAFVIPQGNSFGPIVNAIAGGDLSAIPGGSHPHANFIS